MPYQSITPLRHRYLQRDYLGNRDDDADPLGAYYEDVHQWARTAKTRMHIHCQCLLKAAVNPRLMSAAIDQIGGWKALEDYDEGGFCHWEALRGLRNDVLSGLFRRGEYRRVKIPKPGKTGFRTIEIPDSDSRILARNLCTLLTPLLDPDFYQLSIGFRPSRSIAHGLAAAKHLVGRGKHFMVACDVKDAFGSIPKSRLIQMLRKRLHQSPVIKLIEELLDRQRTRGVPQGLSLSPICLNVYLDHVFDRWWLEKFSHTTLIRYADDIAVFTDSRNDAEAAYEAICKRLLPTGLQIKESQQQAIWDLADDFPVEWLGFGLTARSGVLEASLSESAWHKLEAALASTKVRQKFRNLDLNRDQSDMGFQWIVQRAVAIPESSIKDIAGRICLMARRAGLSMDSLDEEEASRAWRIGRKQAKRAAGSVSGWLV